MSQSWDAQSLLAGKSLRWHCGPLVIAIRREEQDWAIAGQFPDEGPEPAVEETDWTYWPVSKPADEVIFQPRLPDRPLVVRPRNALMLSPGEEVALYVGIPMVVEIRAGRAEGAPVLGEYPTVRLSDTWFGDHFEGELCYALKTPSQRKLEAVDEGHHIAICPLLIRNRSDISLDCQRICVRAPHLYLYRDKTRHWTNHLQVTYQGRDQISRIEYGEGAPPGSPEATLISRPRDLPPRNLFRRTFRFQSI